MAEHSVWTWDEANATRMGEYLTKIELDLILKTLSCKEKPSILDIGVGSGRITIKLLEHKYHNITGMDMGLFQLQKCVVNTDNLIPVLLADADKLPFAARSFDVMLAMQIVDYLPSIEGFLSSCYRILNPGGHLLFDFSNRASPYHFVYKYLYRTDRFYNLSLSKINETAQRVGFSIEKVYGFRWIPFARNSNNLLIPFLARTENCMRPLTPPAFSPWIFSILRK